MKKSIGAQTIVYPAPIFIIGTYDKSGNPNLMAVAWGGICCSKPPCVAISVRKERLTYENLIQTNSFTVNIPSEKYVKESDYVGMISGRSENKFEKCKLTPVKSTIVNAPYVNEFPFNLECTVIKIMELGSHVQFIGEIKDVKADNDVLDDEGLPSIKKIKAFSFSPSDMAYYSTGPAIADAFSSGKKAR